MLREEYLVLRPFLDDDQKPLACLADKKKIWDNVRDFFPSPYTNKDAEAFINMAKQEKIPVTFAAEFKGRFCGVIGLIRQSDVYRNTAEIGYWIGEPFWNQGIATLAVKLITDYGFNTLNLIRIHTGVFEYNTGSMRVLEKNGYRKDGIFKKAISKNGEIWDEHRFSITR